MPNWSGKTGTKDPRQWLGFFKLGKKNRKANKTVCKGLSKGRVSTCSSPTLPSPTTLAVTVPLHRHLMDLAPLVLKNKAK